MGSTCLSSRAPSRRRVGAQRAAAVYVALLRGDPRGFWHPKRTNGNRRVRPSTVDTPEHQRIVELDAAKPFLLCYHPTPIVSLLAREPTRTVSGQIPKKEIVFILNPEKSFPTPGPPPRTRLGSRGPRERGCSCRRPGVRRRGPADMVVTTFSCRVCVRARTGDCRASRAPPGSAIRGENSSPPGAGRTPTVSRRDRLGVAAVRAAAACRAAPSAARRGRVRAPRPRQEALLAPMGALRAQKSANGDASAPRALWDIQTTAPRARGARSTA